MLNQDVKSEINDSDFYSNDSSNFTEVTGSNNPLSGFAVGG